MNKTLETLDQVKDSSTNIAGKCWLPNPELFIIVNGKPTKGKVVWRNLVNVNHVKVAINKLKEINWLYKDITDDSVDEAAKQVIEKYPYNCFVMNIFQSLLISSFAFFLNL